MILRCCARVCDKRGQISELKISPPVSDWYLVWRKDDFAFISKDNFLFISKTIAQLSATTTPCSTACSDVIRPGIPASLRSIIKPEVLPSKGPNPQDQRFPDFHLKTVRNMSKILAVFGATGQQGSSIINYVLQDPELSQQYKIRAITRDVNSEKAKQLKENVEVVHGDVLNRASLETALTGVHTVFAMTTPTFDLDGGLEAEYNSGKTIADVTVEKGAEYIIFSTLPPVKDISGGKYSNVIHFDAKAKVEQYIQGLHIKSAFYSPGVFMQNFQTNTVLAPRQASDGTWIIALHSSPESQWPMIDAVGDTGKFVGAILAEPDRYEGKTFCAASALPRLEEVAATVSKATGKTVIYKQIPVEDFKKSLPFGQDIFPDSFRYIEEFGYWGPDSEGLVAWAAENARGKLSTFEEYLKAHPLQLA